MYILHIQVIGYNLKNCICTEDSRRFSIENFKFKI